MKKSNFLGLLCLLTLGSCSQKEAGPDNTPNLRELSASETSVSATDNDFAFTLFRNIQAGSKENIFISPLSVGMALGMTLNGAAGETKDGILQTIRFGSMEPTAVNEGYRDLRALLTSMDREIDLRFANSVWYANKYTVSTDFSAVVKDYYDGKAGGLDFANSASKQTINSWVEEKTNHRIKNLIESISSGEVMFLINAIYFKGSWASKFDKSQTHQADFDKENGTKSKVDMMYSQKAELSYFGNRRLSLVDIPYGNGQFNMTILLPNEGFTVTDLVQTLSGDSLTYWLDNATVRTPILEMPKFRMEWKDNLNEPLSNMGMGIAFSDKASFPNLFVTPLSLKISRVIHQTFLEVDEEGTEAAAATAVGIGITSAGPSTDHVIIDHPFVLLIREKHSGVIVFMGQVHDPHP